MKRIRLTIEYNGTNFHGWQKQPDKRTVQGEIEDAILRSIGENVEVFGSGRTDAGVHALNQTAHFDLEAPIPVSKLGYVLNNALPQDIYIKEAKEVDKDFHSRFSIKKKTYEYKIYNNNQKNVFIANRASWMKNPLDIDKMKEGAKVIKGTHDFKGFCSANACVSDYTRTVYKISVEKDGDFVIVSVTGSGFLYNMVRIIVGTLVDYSMGILSLEDIKMAIKEGDRTKAGQTMPACGLYLKETVY